MGSVTMLAAAYTTILADSIIHTMALIHCCWIRLKMGKIMDDPSFPQTSFIPFSAAAAAASSISRMVSMKAYRMSTPSSDLKTRGSPTFGMIVTSLFETRISSICQRRDGGLGEGLLHEAHMVAESAATLHIRYKEASLLPLYERQSPLKRPPNKAVKAMAQVYTQRMHTSRSSQSATSLFVSLSCNCTPFGPTKMEKC